MDQLYARQAFIDRLKTSNISSDSSVTITVSDLVDRTDDAVSEVAVQYALSTSATTAPTIGWSTTASEWEDGKDAILLRVDSSRGTVFKNNAVSTVMSVTIYNGPQE